MPSMLTVPEAFVPASSQRRFVLQAMDKPVELYRHCVHAPSFRELTLDKPMNNARASVPVETRCFLARCLMANLESWFPVEERPGPKASDETGWDNVLRCRQPSAMAMAMTPCQISKLGRNCDLAELPQFFAEMRPRRMSI